MSTISVSSGGVHSPLPFQESDTHKLVPISRWLILLAVIILPITFYTPIWTIQLWAPQYPEGLSMQIWINKLTGDINTINGLNHYIGMAFIEESMFPELKFLGYILGGIIVVGLLAFISNRKFFLNLFTFLIILFAASAMIDMFVWGYKYGHHLDPHAAIKVEGASYQPPLMGYKQLLNFLALSIPATGGIAIFASVIIASLSCFINWWKHRNSKINLPKSILGIVVIALLFSCNAEQEKLNFNRDECAYCGMKLVDNRYGAMLVTSKGKSFAFDDINCMINYKNEKLKDIEIAKQLVIDFSNPGNLIDATKAYFLKNEELKSPMGGNAAAFSNMDSLDTYYNILQGEKTSWELIQENE